MVVSELSMYLYCVYLNNLGSTLFLSLLSNFGPRPPFSIQNADTFWRCESGDSYDLARSTRGTLRSAPPLTCALLMTSSDGKARQTKDPGHRAR